MTSYRVLVEKLHIPFAVWKLSAETSRASHVGAPTSETATSVHGAAESPHKRVCCVFRVSQDEDCSICMQMEEAVFPAEGMVNTNEKGTPYVNACIPTEVPLQLSFQVRLETKTQSNEGASEGRDGEGPSETADFAAERTHCPLICEVSGVIKDGGKQVDDVMPRLDRLPFLFQALTVPLCGLIDVSSPGSSQVVELRPHESSSASATAGNQHENAIPITSSDFVGALVCRVDSIGGVNIPSMAVRRTSELTGDEDKEVVERAGSINRSLPTDASRTVADDTAGPRLSSSSILLPPSPLRLEGSPLPSEQATTDLGVRHHCGVSESTPVYPVEAHCDEGFGTSGPDPGVVKEVMYGTENDDGLESGASEQQDATDISSTAAAQFPGSASLLPVGVSHDGDGHVGAPLIDSTAHELGVSSSSRPNVQKLQPDLLSSKVLPPTPMPFVRSPHGQNATKSVSFSTGATQTLQHETLSEPVGCDLVDTYGPETVVVQRIPDCETIDAHEQVRGGHLHCREEDGMRTRPDMSSLFTESTSYTLQESLYSSSSNQGNSYDSSYTRSSEQSRMSRLLKGRNNGSNSADGHLKCMPSFLGSSKPLVLQSEGASEGVRVQRLATTTAFSSTEIVKPSLSFKRCIEHCLRPSPQGSRTLKWQVDKNAAIVNSVPAPISEGKVDVETTELPGVGHTEVMPTLRSSLVSAAIVCQACGNSPRSSKCSLVEEQTADEVAVDGSVLVSESTQRDEEDVSHTMVDSPEVAIAAACEASLMPCSDVDREREPVVSVWKDENDQSDQENAPSILPLVGPLTTAETTPLVFTQTLTGTVKGQSVPEEEPVLETAVDGKESAGGPAGYPAEHEVKEDIVWLTRLPVPLCVADQEDNNDVTRSVSKACSTPLCSTRLSKQGSDDSNGSPHMSSQHLGKDDEVLSGVPDVPASALHEKSEQEEVSLEPVAATAENEPLNGAHGYSLVAICAYEESLPLVLKDSTSPLLFAYEEEEPYSATPPALELPPPLQADLSPAPPYIFVEIHGLLHLYSVFTSFGTDASKTGASTARRPLRLTIHNRLQGRIATGTVFYAPRQLSLDVHAEGSTLDTWCDIIKLPADAVHVAPSSGDSSGEFMLFVHLEHGVTCEKEDYAAADGGMQSVCEPSVKSMASALKLPETASVGDLVGNIPGSGADEVSAGIRSSAEPEAAVCAKDGEAESLENTTGEVKEAGLKYSQTAATTCQSPAPQPPGCVTPLTPSVTVDAVSEEAIPKYRNEQRGGWMWAPLAFSDALAFDGLLAHSSGDACDSEALGSTSITLRCILNWWKCTAPSSTPSDGVSPGECVLWGSAMTARIGSVYTGTTPPAIQALCRAIRLCSGLSAASTLHGIDASQYMSIASPAVLAGVDELPTMPLTVMWNTIPGGGGRHNSRRSAPSVDPHNRSDRDSTSRLPFTSCTVVLRFSSAVMEKLPGVAYGSLIPQLALCVGGGRGVHLGGTSVSLHSSGLGSVDKDHTSLIYRFDYAVHTTLNCSEGPLVLMSIHSASSREVVFGQAVFNPFQLFSRVVSCFDSAMHTDHPQWRAQFGEAIQGNIWIPLSGCENGNEVGSCEEHVGWLHCDYEVVPINVAPMQSVLLESMNEFTGSLGHTCGGLLDLCVMKAAGLSCHSIHGDACNAYCEVTGVVSTQGCNPSALSTDKADARLQQQDELLTTNTVCGTRYPVWRHRYRFHAGCVHAIVIRVFHRLEKNDFMTAPSPGLAATWKDGNEDVQLLGVVTLPAYVLLRWYSRAESDNGGVWVPLVRFVDEYNSAPTFHGSIFLQWCRVGQHYSVPFAGGVAQDMPTCIVQPVAMKSHRIENHSSEDELSKWAVALKWIRVQQVSVVWPWLHHVSVVMGCDLYLQVDTLRGFRRRWPLKRVVGDEGDEAGGGSLPSLDSPVLFTLPERTFCMPFSLEMEWGIYLCDEGAGELMIGAGVWRLGQEAVLHLQSNAFAEVEGMVWLQPTQSLWRERDRETWGSSLVDNRFPFPHRIEQGTILLRFASLPDTFPSLGILGPNESVNGLAAEVLHRWRWPADGAYAWMDVRVLDWVIYTPPDALSEVEASLAVFENDWVGSGDGFSDLSWAQLCEKVCQADLIYTKRPHEASKSGPRHGIRRHRHLLHSEPRSRPPIASAFNQARDVSPVFDEDGSVIRLSWKGRLFPFFSRDLPALFLGIGKPTRPSENGTAGGKMTTVVAVTSLSFLWTLARSEGKVWLPLFSSATGAHTQTGLVCISFHHNFISALTERPSPADRIEMSPALDSRRSSSPSLLFPSAAPVTSTPLYDDVQADRKGPSVVSKALYRSLCAPPSARGFLTHNRVLVVGVSHLYMREWVLASRHDQRLPEHVKVDVASATLTVGYSKFAFCSSPMQGVVNGPVEDVFAFPIPPEEVREHDMGKIRVQVAVTGRSDTPSITDDIETLHYECVTLLPSHRVEDDAANTSLPAASTCDGQQWLTLTCRCGTAQYASGEVLVRWRVLSATSTSGDEAPLARALLRGPEMQVCCVAHPCRHQEDEVASKNLPSFEEVERQVCHSALALLTDDQAPPATYLLLDSVSWVSQGTVGKRRLGGQLVLHVRLQRIQSSKTRSESALSQTPAESLAEGYADQCVAAPLCLEDEGRVDMVSFVHHTSKKIVFPVNWANAEGSTMLEVTLFAVQSASDDPVRLAYGQVSYARGSPAHMWALPLFESSGTLPDEAFGYVQWYSVESPFPRIWRPLRDQKAVRGDGHIRDHTTATTEGLASMKDDVAGPVSLLIHVEVSGLQTRGSNSNIMPDSSFSTVDVFLQVPTSAHAEEKTSLELTHLTPCLSAPASDERGHPFPRSEELPAAWYGDVCVLEGSQIHMYVVAVWGKQKGDMYRACVPDEGNGAGELLLCGKADFRLSGVNQRVGHELGICLDLLNMGSGKVMGTVAIRRTVLATTTSMYSSRELFMDRVVELRFTNCTGLVHGSVDQLIQLAERYRVVMRDAAGQLKRLGHLTRRMRRKVLACLMAVEQHTREAPQPPLQLVLRDAEKRGSRGPLFCVPSAQQRLIATDAPSLSLRTVDGPPSYVLLEVDLPIGRGVPLASNTHVLHNVDVETLDLPVELVATVATGPSSNSVSEVIVAQGEWNLSSRVKGQHALLGEATWLRLMTPPPATASALDEPSSAFVQAKWRWKTVARRGHVCVTCARLMVAPSFLATVVPLHRPYLQFIYRFSDGMEHAQLLPLLESEALVTPSFSARASLWSLASTWVPQVGVFGGQLIRVDLLDVLEHILETDGDVGEVSTCLGTHWWTKQDELQIRRLSNGSRRSSQGVEKEPFASPAEFCRAVNLLWLHFVNGEVQAPYRALLAVSHASRPSLISRSLSDESDMRAGDEKVCRVVSLELTCLSVELPVPPSFRDEEVAFVTCTIRAAQTSSATLDVPSTPNDPFQWVTVIDRRKCNTLSIQTASGASGDATYQHSDDMRAHIVWISQDHATNPIVVPLVVGDLRRNCTRHVLLLEFEWSATSTDTTVPSYAGCCTVEHLLDGAATDIGGKREFQLYTKSDPRALAGTMRLHWTLDPWSAMPAKLCIPLTNDGPRRTFAGVPEAKYIHNLFLERQDGNNLRTWLNDYTFGCGHMAQGSVRQIEDGLIEGAVCDERQRRRRRAMRDMTWVLAKMEVAGLRLPYVAKQDSATILARLSLPLHYRSKHKGSEIIENGNHQCRSDERDGHQREIIGVAKTVLAPLFQSGPQKPPECQQACPLYNGTLEGLGWEVSLSELRDPALWGKAQLTLWHYLNERAGVGDAAVVDNPLVSFIGSVQLMDVWRHIWELTESLLSSAEGKEQVHPWYALQRKGYRSLWIPILHVPLAPGHSAANTQKPARVRLHFRAPCYKPLSLPPSLVIEPHAMLLCVHIAEVRFVGEGVSLLRDTPEGSYDLPPMAVLFHVPGATLWSTRLQHVVTSAPTLKSPSPAPRQVLDIAPNGDHLGTAEFPQTLPQPEVSTYTTSPLQSIYACSLRCVEPPYLTVYLAQCRPGVDPEVREEDVECLLGKSEVSLDLLFDSTSGNPVDGYKSSVSRCVAIDLAADDKERAAGMCIKRAEMKFLLFSCPTRSEVVRAKVCDEKQRALCPAQPVEVSLREVHPFAHSRPLSIPFSTNGLSGFRVAARRFRVDQSKVPVGSVVCDCSRGAIARGSPFVLMAGGVAHEGQTEAAGTACVKGVLALVSLPTTKLMSVGRGAKRHHSLVVSSSRHNNAIVPHAGAWQPVSVLITGTSHGWCASVGSDLENRFGHVVCLYEDATSGEPCLLVDGGIRLLNESGGWGDGGRLSGPGTCTERFSLSRSQQERGRGANGLGRSRKCLTHVKYRMMADGTKRSTLHPSPPLTAPSSRRGIGTDERLELVGIPQGTRCYSADGPPQEVLAFSSSEEEEDYTYIHHAAAQIKGQVWFFGGWKVPKSFNRWGVHSDNECGSFVALGTTSRQHNAGSRLVERRRQEVSLAAKRSCHLPTRSSGTNGSEDGKPSSTNPFVMELSGDVRLVNVRQSRSECPAILKVPSLKRWAESQETEQLGLAGDTVDNHYFPPSFIPVEAAPKLACHTAMAHEDLIYLFGGLMPLEGNLPGESVMCSNDVFVFHSRQLTWGVCRERDHLAAAAHVAGGSSWPLPRYGHSTAVLPPSPDLSGPPTYIICGGATAAPLYGGSLPGNTEISLVPREEMLWFFRPCNLYGCCWRRVEVPLCIPLSPRFLPAVYAISCKKGESGSACDEADAYFTLLIAGGSDSNGGASSLKSHLPIGDRCSAPYGHLYRTYMGQWLTGRALGTISLTCEWLSE